MRWNPFIALYYNLSEDNESNLFEKKKKSFWTVWCLNGILIIFIHQRWEAQAHLPRETLSQYLSGPLLEKDRSETEQLSGCRQIQFSFAFFGESIWPQTKLMVRQKMWNLICNLREQKFVKMLSFQLRMIKL